MAHFAHHLLTALPVPLLPFIRDNFQLDYTRSGLIISAFSLAYGIGQLPAGWLADRIGPRWLITIGTCGVALAGLLVGISQTYIMMIIFLVLMGVLGGGYHPAAVPLISASVEPKNQGRALGIHMIGGSGSFFLAPLIAAAIAAAWGWRSSFLALAIPTILFSFLFYWFLGRQTKIMKGQTITGENQGIVASPQNRWRHLVAFIFLSVFTQAILFSVIAFIPLFLVDHFGVSQRTAATLLAIIYSAGLWAGPLGGFLADRWGKIAIILTISFIAGINVYLLNLASYGLGIGASLLLMGAVMFIRMPVSEAYILNQAPAGYRSAVLGIYYFSNMEGGGVLTPFIGSLIDQRGFSFTFTAAGATLVIVTLICAFFLRNHKTSLRAKNQG